MFTRYGWVLAGLLLAAGTAMAAPAHERGRLVIDGQARSFLLDGARGTGPQPTVIFLHGASATAAYTARITGFPELARREGFAVVFPQGLHRIWIDGRPEHVRQVTARYGAPPDDVAFIRRLVADLIDRGIADPRRIYLGGLSNGGFMTYRMACETPELFAAIGVVIASMPEDLIGGCHPGVAMPIVVMNATADRTIPYDGGALRYRDGKVLSTERTLAFFRALDGCSDRSTRALLPSADPGTHGITVMRWTQCTRAPVVLYRVEGGSHRLPGLRGPAAKRRNFNAAAELWAFFRDKSR